MSKAVLQPRKSKITTHYINNDEMLRTITPYHYAYKEYLKSGKMIPKPAIPAYIGECILQIVTRLALKPQFRNYSYVDEMQEDAIENCIQYAHNFNPEKSSYVFSYFTKMCFFAFVRRINKEQREQYTRHKIFERSYMYD